MLEILLCVDKNNLIIWWFSCWAVLHLSSFEFNL